MSNLISFIKRQATQSLTTLQIKLDLLTNDVWHNYPFGKKPLASKEEYLRLAEEVRQLTYEEIEEYEKKTGFSIDHEWLHELALHTQVVIKESPLCYAHGKLIYSALSHYLKSNPAKKSNDCVNIWETGTARGFSSLCMAKALNDQKRSGKILTFDVLPHQTPMYWNCIDDWDKPKTRAELLQPWDSLLQNYLIFHQGDTRIELPKVKTGRINFAFLDGSHSYNDVMFEFGQINKYQKIGDIIIYDDYNPQQFPDLVRAVDEICEKNKYHRTDLKASSDRGYVIAEKSSE